MKSILIFLVFLTLSLVTEAQLKFPDPDLHRIDFPEADPEKKNQMLKIYLEKNEKENEEVYYLYKKVIYDSTGRPMEAYEYKPEIEDVFSKYSYNYDDTSRIDYFEHDDLVFRWTFRDSLLIQVEKSSNATAPYNWKFEYSAEGKLLKRLKMDEEGERVYSERFVYDNLGRTVCSCLTGEKYFNRMAVYRYDLAKGITHLYIINALKLHRAAKRLKIERDELCGYPVEKILEKIGNRVQREEKHFNDEGRMIAFKSFSAEGEKTGDVLFEYDEQGRLVEEKIFLTDLNLHQIEVYKYNDAGNVVEKAVYVSDGEKRNLSGIVEWKYDSDGNLSEKIVWNAHGNPDDMYSLTYVRGEKP